MNNFAKRWLYAGLLACWGWSSTMAQPQTVDPNAFFDAKIGPVLVKHCYGCHSVDAAKANKLKAGLFLDSRSGLQRGGESGPVIVAGKPADSPLIAALRHEGLEMPPSGKLPDGVIADFVKWIELGAPDPRDQSTAVAAGLAQKAPAQ